MPHYFLNVYNANVALDEEGDDFPDLAAAREKAVLGVRSILAEEVKGGQFDLRGRIEIADESGAILMLVPYSDAVSVRLPEAPADGSVAT